MLQSNHPPGVSVIIPFLNEERFLREAIESVLQQEYVDWELVLVDDGSTDQSPQIAKQYAVAHPDRIFYYSHENHQNKGLSATRNLGIKHSNGELIALLDADDVWMPSKLLNQVKLFDVHPRTGMLCEASLYWHSWSNSMKADQLVKIGETLEGVYPAGSLCKLLYPLGKGSAPCPSGIMMKKEVWQQVGGFEESFKDIYQLYEDQAFLCKVYLEYEVYISQECNNLYRQREGSLVQSVKANGQYHTVRKHYLEYFSDYLQKRKINDPGLLKLVHKAYLPYGKGLKNLMGRITNKAEDYLSRLQSKV